MSGIHDFCYHCGATLPREELLEASHLEFFLSELESLSDVLPGPLFSELKLRYKKRLAILNERLNPPPFSIPLLTAAAPVEALDSTVQEEATPLSAETAESRKISFYEWLFSERSVKIALYTGAFLLLLAGVIFVRSRWGEMAGEAKFAVLFLITGLLYLCGYLLFQNPRVRVGGIAILGLASGFAPLDFAILQIYVLGPHGFNDEIMFLTASLACLLIYFLTAIWTRADLFAYLGVVALVTSLTGALKLLDATENLYFPCFLLLALLLLLTGRALGKTPPSAFIGRPLLISAQVATPLLLAGPIVNLLWSGGSRADLAGLFMGVAFYAATDFFYRALAARWCTAILIPLLAVFTLDQLRIPFSLAGLCLMLISVAYLALGSYLERRENRRLAGLPFYVVAYLAAFWITSHSAGDALHLLKALAGDVLILAVSGYIHRNRFWMYAATWLFLLLFYIALTLFVPEHSYWGLLMGLLSVNYLLAGVFLGRDEVRSGAPPSRGGPFLSAAAAAGVLMLVLSWGYPVIAAPLAALAAVCLLFVALWLKAPYLLLPALLALDVAVYPLLEIFLGTGVPPPATLGGVYAAMTFALFISAMFLLRGPYSNWSSPFFIVGFINMAGSYLLCFSEEVPAAILSVVYALLILRLAWPEKYDAEGEKKEESLNFGDGSLLSYVSFFLMGLGALLLLKIIDLLQYWPPVFVLLGGAFVLISGRLGEGPLFRTYGAPSRNTGHMFLALSAAGALLSLNFVNVSATFSLIGLAGVLEATRKKSLTFSYLASGAFLIVYWSVLIHSRVEELQLYVLPPGLLLLIFGWMEHRRLNESKYNTLTKLGLILLLGSSILQSLVNHDYFYSVWLGAESLAAMGLGFRIRSRRYLGWGATALIINALALLGPELYRLDRWIQLALTGAILLSGGLAVLFKRDEIAKNYETIQMEWKRWDT
ncbi:MAG: hypothetical protein V2A78_03150 [bacterium]